MGPEIVKFLLPKTQNKDTTSSQREVTLSVDSTVKMAEVFPGRFAVVHESDKLLDRPLKLKIERPQNVSLRTDPQVPSFKEVEITPFTKKGNGIREVERKTGEPVEYIIPGMYWGANLSTQRIAQKLNVPETSINYWVKKMGMEKRKKSEASQVNWQDDILRASMNAKIHTPQSLGKRIESFKENKRKKRREQEEKQKEAIIAILGEDPVGRIRELQENVNILEDASPLRWDDVAAALGDEFTPTQARRAITIFDKDFELGYTSSAGPVGGQRNARYEALYAHAMQAGVLRYLPERERTIIGLKYHPDLTPLPNAEIGVAVGGISLERVRQIEFATFHKVQNLLAFSERYKEVYENVLADLSEQGGTNRKILQLAYRYKVAPGHISTIAQECGFYLGDEPSEHRPHPRRFFPKYQTPEEGLEIDLLHLSKGTKDKLEKWGLQNMSIRDLDATPDEILTRTMHGFRILRLIELRTAINEFRNKALERQGLKEEMVEMPEHVVPALLGRINDSYRISYAIEMAVVAGRIPADVGAIASMDAGQIADAVYPFNFGPESIEQLRNYVFLKYAPRF